MKQTKFLAMLFMAFAVAFSACTNVDDPDEPTDGDGAKLPFTETFETGMGKFTAQSVVGEQKWEYSTSYKYVLISGYINATTTNVPNEDWLISPEISLAGVTSAKLTFEHASRYFGDINNEATVWVSENYKEGLPATGTWTKVTTPAFKDAGNWTMVSSGEISLKAFAGKNIRIALKYVSTNTKAGSWQLKNFKVEEGEATVIPEDEAKGEGTEASPYNIKAAMDNQGGIKWIEGYIVGNIDGEGKDMSKESKFAAPFTINTNVLMADKAGETDVNKCFPVQLPAGVIRDGLNLVTNGTVLGKKVKLYGSLETYFGKAGIKSPSYFAIDGGATGGTIPTAGEFNVPVMTISELRTQWTGAMKTITDKKKIVGVVITDLVGGNSGSLRNLTIASEDNSAGIMVRLIENNTYSLGDKIEIAVEGLELNQFGMAVQLNNVPVVKTRRISTGATVTPKVTTIKDVRDNFASYESRLVTVTGTLTSGGGNTWYSGTGSGQNNKIASGTDELVLYVTKFAAFKAEVVPTGEKSVTGIVSQFSNATSTTYQLIIRNMADVK